MFIKCVFYLLIINFYVCSTKVDNYFKDLNILLERDTWKTIDNLWKNSVIVECNPDEQIVNGAEIFQKDESQNEIITNDNYKIKVPKLFLLYSAVHAIKLQRIIDVVRGFWLFCEGKEEIFKKTFLDTLFEHRVIFRNMLDALSFIGKFKNKGPLLISDYPRNEVINALNHLNVLSNSNSQINTCIDTELNGAYNSIKHFITSHFRPVPLYILDDQNYISVFYKDIKNNINDNNKTIDEKMEFLKNKLNYELMHYHIQQVHKLGFLFYEDSHLVGVLPLNNTFEEPSKDTAPAASDDEDDD